MSITSINFAIFALAAALIYNLAPGGKSRQYVFLAINLGFFASFSHQPATYIPMLAFVAIGYGGIRLMQTTKGRRYFWYWLTAVIGSFFWLKKYTFVPSALFLEVPYLTIGLSYIFFRVMQMSIDIGEEETQEPIGLLVYLNFIFNFTTLISGPIQRYQDFAQMHNAQEKPALNLISIGSAIERIAIGAFKVLVMAAFISIWQKQGIQDLSADAPLLDRALAGIALSAFYTIYLYFNFSGYTDIVIGIGRFFGLELPENFNRPFAATNFLDFWSCWHITLSNWLKFYVYNPLVMSLMTRFPSPSVEPYLGVFAFFVTFFLMGFWHGQTGVFAIYGLLLGLGVSANKLYRIWIHNLLGKKGYKALAANIVYQSVSRGLTFTWYSMSLICFWADWSQISDFSGKLGWSAAGLAFVILWAIATLVLAALEAGRNLALSITIGNTPVLLSHYTRTAWVTALVVISAAVTELMNGPAQDIVYKNF